MSREGRGRNLAFDFTTLPTIAGGLDAALSHGNPLMTASGILLGLGIAAIPSEFFGFTKRTEEKRS